VTTGAVGAAALCVVAGVGGAVQVAVMGRFGERVGTFEALAYATLVTAALSAATLLAVRRSLAGYSAGLHAPAWLWVGGVMSALIVLTITVVTPVLGAAATVGVFIAAQLAAGAAIDRFGLFDTDRIALGWPRLVGLSLLAVGAGLTIRT
jgi:bacterial/archaeal transporter family-2 protein